MFSMLPLHHAFQGGVGVSLTFPPASSDGKEVSWGASEGKEHCITLTRCSHSGIASRGGPAVISYQTSIVQCFIVIVVVYGICGKQGKERSMREGRARIRRGWTYTRKPSLCEITACINMECIVCISSSVRLRVCCDRRDCDEGGQGERGEEHGGWDVV